MSAGRMKEAKLLMEGFGMWCWAHTGSLHPVVAVAKLTFLKKIWSLQYPLLLTVTTGL